MSNSGRGTRDSYEWHRWAVIGIHTAPRQTSMNRFTRMCHYRRTLDLQQSSGAKGAHSLFDAINAGRQTVVEVESAESLRGFDRPYSKPSTLVVLVVREGNFYWQRLPPRVTPSASIVSISACNNCILQIDLIPPRILTPALAVH